MNLVDDTLQRCGCCITCFFFVFFTAFRWVVNSEPLYFLSKLCPHLLSIHPFSRPALHTGRCCRALLQPTAALTRSEAGNTTPDMSPRNLRANTHMIDSHSHTSEQFRVCNRPKHVCFFGLWEETQRATTPVVLSLISFCKH